MAQAINPPADEIVEYEPVHPAEVLPRIEKVHDELHELCRLVRLLHELVDPLSSPAQLTTVALTAQKPVQMQDERGITTASLGILNPSEAEILVGVGGEQASSQARAIVVPPNALMVLPVAAGDVEIGTEAELGEGEAVVHLFRYETVQAAFLGVAP